ncbi:MAG: glycosyltransferase family protein [Bacillota bacterium]
MKILLINEWYNPVVQNMISYFTQKIGSDFEWTGKRWYRKDFLPMDHYEESSLIPEPVALDKLQQEYYDYVIYSDASLMIYLSSHFKKTKRILIDSMDSFVIPEVYLKNCEFYFKSQYQSQDNKFFIKQQSGEIKLESSSKIHPFCLTPSFKVSQVESLKLDYPKEHDVFFNGSAHPQERVKIINTIKKNKDIDFIGGLYNRHDLKFNNVVPSSIKYEKMNMSSYIFHCKKSKINLNMIGNGFNCFRQFEILCLSGFLLTPKTPNKFAFIEPEDRKHCVFYDSPRQAVEMIKFYLKNEDSRKNISTQGNIYYNKYLHPSKIVDKILLTITKND